MFSLLSFIGNLVGILLAKFIPEELAPGKKYILLFKKLVLFLILIIPVYYFKISIIYFALGLIIAFVLRKVYLYLGLVLILSMQIKELNLIIASLIFIYSITYSLLIKNKLDIVSDLALFLISVILLYNGTNITYNSEIFSFTIGSILVMLKYDK